MLQPRMELHYPSLWAWRGKGALEYLQRLRVPIPSTVFAASVWGEGFCACLGGAEVWLCAPDADSLTAHVPAGLRTYRRADAVFKLTHAQSVLAQICAQDFRQLTSAHFSFAATMGVDAWFWRHPDGNIWLGVEAGYADYVQQTLTEILQDGV